MGVVGRATRLLMGIVVGEMVDSGAPGVQPGVIFNWTGQLRLSVAPLEYSWVVVVGEVVDCGHRAFGWFLQERSGQ